MNAEEREQWIGNQGLLNHESKGDQEDMYFPVEVKDAKKQFGRVFLKVHPVNGDGEQWVDAARVDFDKTSHAQS